MKKVALATCFLDNYGACLQAYSLQRKIDELGYNVEILNYIEPEGYDNNRSILHKLTVNPITRKLYSIISSNYKKRYVFKYKCASFRKKFLKISSQKLYSYAEAESLASQYECFVCGSDQIWNPTFYGRLNRFYYLDFADGKKRVSYAPSIGISDIDEEYRHEFRRMLNKFDALSVREQTGKQLVEKYAGRSARVVLDPTLLISGDSWKSLSAEEYSPNSTFPPRDKKYIFCYLFGNRPFYYSFIDSIQSLLKIDVYIVPFEMNIEGTNYHPIYGAGPLDFVSLIRNASIVITDSFHATAFSVNMNTPFYTLLRNAANDKKSMNSRVLDLLQMVGLQTRLWKDDMDIATLTTSINWDNANSVLENKRQEDMAFLQESLR